MVHMLIGIQGSGKTTFANEFAKNNNCLIASTDYVRKNMKEIPESEVFPTVYKLIAEAVKNDQDIIYDATNITPNVRKRFFDEVGKHNVTPEVIAYYFDTDVMECFKRVKIRNTIEGELYLPEEVVFSYNEKIVRPTLEEGFKRIKIVKNGTIVATIEYVEE